MREVQFGKMKARHAIRSLTVFVFLCGCLLPSRAQELPREPILRIDVGQHASTIWAINTDRAGRWIVSSSADGTARVWNAATGQMERVLRPPIEAGRTDLFAIAISPDGTLVACGGETGGVYLFLRTKGEIVGHAELPQDKVWGLAFSPDGGMLAATLLGGRGKGGLRIFALDKTGNPSSPGSMPISLRLIAEDHDYGETVLSVDFSRDGRGLVTTAGDAVRLYELGRVNEGSRTSVAIPPKVTLRTPLAQGPLTAKFSPDGSKVAVGFAGAFVAVFSANDLHLLYAPDVHDIVSGGRMHGDLSVVAWSRDGGFLFAAGGYNGPSYEDMVPMLVRRWAAGGQGRAVDFPVGAATEILSLVSLPDESLAYGSVDSTLGMLGPDGRQAWLVRSSLVDWRATRHSGDCTGSFRLSQDGSTVAFNYNSSAGAEPATFSLATRSLIFRQADASLSPPRVSAPGLDLRSWCDKGRIPTLNGKRVAIDEDSSSHATSVAIAPDGQSFLLASPVELGRVGYDGSDIWHGLSSEILWAVNIAGNGRVCRLGSFRRNHSLVPLLRWQETGNLLRSRRPQALGAVDTQRVL